LGEFDLEAKLWTIPGKRMKAGREHRVPLTDAAMAVLAGLDRDERLPVPVHRHTLARFLARMGWHGLTIQASARRFAIALRSRRTTLTRLPRLP
jgi:integrase